jgi:GT2 family glycosyltransferase
MKRVLVIVVTYNGMRWLDRCLSSSTNKAENVDETVVLGFPSTNGAKIVDGGLQVDTYVLDNDSTDGSADYIQAHFPQAHLVRSAENLGFTGGNNLGFQYALEHGYDYVYLLNQDAWLEEGALEKLVSAAEAHPDYAVLSPLQMTDGYKAFDTQFAKCIADSHPDRKAPAGARPGRVFAERQIRKGEKAAGVYEGAEPPVLSAKRIMAAHWLMPVKAVKEIGLFSDLFPYYGQDDDWCHRAHYHGWKVGVVPQARAVHDRAQRQESKERIIDRNYRVGSLVRLCDINRPLWERFLFVCLFTLVKAVKYGSFLPFKHFRSLCRQFPAIREHRQKSRLPE